MAKIDVKKRFEELIGEVQEITASGLPFMDGKEKLEVKGEILNNILTVDDYGYLEGDNGEYVVLALKEYPNHFIYGTSVVTQSFKKFDEKFTDEDREFILENGLTFALTEHISANKRRYVKVTFFPKN